jgi:hypothetical protein
VYWGRGFENTSSFQFEKSPTGLEKGESALLPDQTVLGYNYPNPFNPSTTISYGLPQKAHVRLEVFSMLGQRVAMLVDGEQEAGYHLVRFDGTGLASGLFFYRLRAGDFVETKRFLLLR